MSHCSPFSDSYISSGGCLTTHFPSTLIQSGWDIVLYWKFYCPATLDDFLNTFETYSSLGWGRSRMCFSQNNIVTKLRLLSLKSQNMCSLLQFKTLCNRQFMSHISILVTTYFVLNSAQMQFVTWSVLTEWPLLVHLEVCGRYASLCRHLCGPDMGPIRGQSLLSRGLYNQFFHEKSRKSTKQHNWRGIGLIRFQFQVHQFIWSWIFMTWLSKILSFFNNRHWEYRVIKILGHLYLFWSWYSDLHKSLLWLEYKWDIYTRNNFQSEYNRKQKLNMWR